MQITINESEIKTAIRNHILSQISVNQNMKIDIDLMATRGPQGYTAVIDIHPEGGQEEPEPTPPVKPAGTKAKAVFSPAVRSEPMTKAEPAPKPEPEVEAKVEAATANEASTDAEVPTAANDAEATTEPKADQAPRKSIFAGLTKPSNQPATA